MSTIFFKKKRCSFQQIFKAKINFLIISYEIAYYFKSFEKTKKLKRQTEKIFLYLPYVNSVKG